MLKLLRSELAAVVRVPSGGTAYPPIALLAHRPHRHFAFLKIITVRWTYATISKSVSSRRPLFVTTPDQCRSSSGEAGTWVAGQSCWRRSDIWLITRLEKGDWTSRVMAENKLLRQNAKNTKHYFTIFGMLIENLITWTKEKKFKPLACSSSSNSSFSFHYIHRRYKITARQN